MDDLKFRFFSTVFQSCQDDERLLVKGCMQWNDIHVKDATSFVCDNLVGDIIPET